MKKYSHYIFLLFFLLVSSMKIVYSKDAKILLGVFKENRFQKFQQSSYFHLFSDNQFVFTSKFGNWNHCQENNDSGIFKGSLDSSEVKKIMGNLKKLNGTCDKTSSCLRNIKNKRHIDSHWRVRDYVNKKSYFFVGNKLPKLITFLLKNANALKQKPVETLELFSKGSSLKVLFRGEESYMFSNEPLDYLVFDSQKKLISSTELTKKEVQNKSISLSPGETLNVDLPFDVEKIKRPFYVMYNSQNAHHLMKRSFHFMPCLKFD